MSSSDLQTQWASSYLSGGSMAYVDGLYEDYLTDPNSVPADWRAAFDALPTVDGVAKEISHRDIRDYFLHNSDKKRVQVVTSQDSKQYQVAHLMNAYRAHGHHAAKLDPLGMAERVNVPSLELSYHQLSEADMNRSFLPVNISMVLRCRYVKYFRHCVTLIAVVLVLSTCIFLITRKQNGCSKKWSLLAVDLVLISRKN